MAWSNGEGGDRNPLDRQERPPGNEGSTSDVGDKSDPLAATSALERRRADLAELDEIRSDRGPPKQSPETSQGRPFDPQKHVARLDRKRQAPGGMTASDKTLTHALRLSPSNRRVSLGFTPHHHQSKPQAVQEKPVFHDVQGSAALAIARDIR